MSAGAAILLAWRAFASRPRRTIVLLLGYGLGVAVMIALLAVGDALLDQAQDRDVVAGGDVVLLPQGIDPDVLKVGAVTGMYLAIPNARFLLRQVLMGPRYAGTVDSASPEVIDKLVYLRTPGGEVSPTRASGALPSAARRTRSALRIVDERWPDQAADHDWIAPEPAALLGSIDRFHTPPVGAVGRSWAEWWYFKFVSQDAPRGSTGGQTTAGPYGYVSFIANRDRRVRVGATVRLPGGRLVRWIEDHNNGTLPLAGSRVLTYGAGPHRMELREGVYRISLRRAGFSATLTIRPLRDLYFPPILWEAPGLRSGYVVPVLAASVTGALRVGDETFPIDGIAYHDHNWGTWQGVSWEWGTVQTAGYVLLMGLFRHPALPPQHALVSLYASGPRPGLLATMRGAIPVLEAWRRGRTVGGREVRVPGILRYQAVNDAGDRLQVAITTQDVIATALGTEEMTGSRARVSARNGPGIAFLQIRGRYRVTGRVAGRPINFSATGFAETFLPLPPVGGAGAP